MERRKFDVVIAGAGSAGCVAANQLCQARGLSVCLLEAGPDYGPLSDGRWPPELLDARFRPLTHDWGYKIDQGGRARFVDPRAKVMGGCSSHNECAAIWGLPMDYDAWAQAGNPGWSYREMRPLLDRIEGVTPDSKGKFRGNGGPLFTRRSPESQLAYLQNAFIDASVKAGFPVVDDLSAPEPLEGVGPYHANVKDSVRWNTALAFLDPVRKSQKLTVLDNSLVDHLIMEGRKARGLVYRSGGEVQELRADLFLICAGTYGSPAILLRSGIGPADQLRKAGIPVAVELNGVGKNLHDHPSYYVLYEASEEALRQVRKDIARGNNHRCQVMLKARSTHCQAAFDLHLMPVLVTSGPNKFIPEIMICNLTPYSRGELRLRSWDPELLPKIETRYMTDPEDRDMDILVDGFQVAGRLAQEEPLASALAGETGPWKRLGSDAAIRRCIRKNVLNYSHAVGTCKMGPYSDPGAVVGASGRVYGADNVYVADASIMPVIPRANTNLTSMLIGMKIADSLPF